MVAWVGCYEDTPVRGRRSCNVRPLRPDRPHPTGPLARRVASPLADPVPYAGLGISPCHDGISPVAYLASGSEAEIQ